MTEYALVRPTTPPPAEPRTFAPAPEQGHAGKSLVPNTLLDGCGPGGKVCVCVCVGDTE